MRERGRAGWLVGLVVVSGCTLADPTLTSRSEFAGLPVLNGSDVVIMDIALVEVPPGELFINRDLWTNLDEQIGGVESTAIWDQNGFRLGHVGGIPPGRLQAMLTSERSCPKPHRVRIRTGNTKVVPLGPVRHRCEIDLHDGPAIEPTAFDQAQFQFAVTPSIAEDGRVHLRLSPRLKHSGPPRYPQIEDGSEWPLAVRQTVERFPGLDRVATVSPRDYLIVGTRIERPKTIGYESFVDADPDRPVQRLLVVRARAASDVNEFSAPFVADLPVDASGPVPPARQAAARAANR